MSKKKKEEIWVRYYEKKVTYKMYDRKIIIRLIKLFKKHYIRGSLLLKACWKLILRNNFSIETRQ